MITNIWENKENMSTVRGSLIAEVYDTDIYTIGGNASTTFLNINEKYNIINNAWSTKLNLLGFRYQIYSSINSSNIFVISGMEYDDSNIISNKNEYYDRLTDNWITKAVIITPRSRLTSLLVNGIIFYMNGTITIINEPSDINEAYMITTDTWIVRDNTASYKLYDVSNIIINVMYNTGGSNGIGVIY